MSAADGSREPFKEERFKMLQAVWRSVSGPDAVMVLKTIGIMLVMILIMGVSCYGCYYDWQRHEQKLALSDQIFGSKKESFFKECLADKKQYECDAIWLTIREYHKTQAWEEAQAIWKAQNEQK